MSPLFHNDTIDEFLLEYAEEHILKLEHIINETERIGEFSSFPQRPFKFGCLITGLTQCLFAEFNSTHYWIDIRH
jgi:hypothetical protein